MTGSYCEFNDAAAKIRGHILGADGVFAGSFRAGSVVVRNKINVQDGSVGTYVLLEPATDMLLEHTVFIPAGAGQGQTLARVYFGFKTEATEQTLSVSILQPNGYTALAYKYIKRIRIKKNGVLYPGLGNARLLSGELGYVEICNRYPALVARDIIQSSIAFIDPQFDSSIDNYYTLRSDILIFSHWDTSYTYSPQYFPIYVVAAATDGTNGPIPTSAPRRIGFNGPVFTEFFFK